MTQEEKFMLEENFLNALAKAYQTYEIGDIPNYLRDDMLYSSFWVFQDIHSKQEYTTYLSGKLATMKESGTVNRFFMLYTQGEGKPFLMVTKKTNQGYGGFFCNCDDEGMIYELHVMPTGFYDLTYKDKEEFEKAISEQS